MEVLEEYHNWFYCKSGSVHFLSLFLQYWNNFVKLWNVHGIKNVKTYIYIYILKVRYQYMEYTI